MLRPIVVYEQTNRGVWDAESAIHHKPHSVHSLPGNTLRAVPFGCHGTNICMYIQTLADHASRLVASLYTSRHDVSVSVCHQNFGLIATTIGLNTSLHHSNSGNSDKTT